MHLIPIKSYGNPYLDPDWETFPLRNLNPVFILPFHLAERDLKMRFRCQGKKKTGRA
jgi:hypothetical protein